MRVFNGINHGKLAEGAPEGTLADLFVWYVDEVGLSNTTAFIGLVKVLAGSPQRYGELADLVRKYEEYEFGGTLAEKEEVK